VAVFSTRGRAFDEKCQGEVAENHRAKGTFSRTRRVQEHSKLIWVIENRGIEGLSSQKNNMLSEEFST
jgi:hypothetical protein